MTLQDAAAELVRRIDRKAHVDELLDIVQYILALLEINAAENSSAKAELEVSEDVAFVLKNHEAMRQARSRICSQHALSRQTGIFQSHISIAERGRVRKISKPALHNLVLVYKKLMELVQ